MLTTRMRFLIGGTGIAVVSYLSGILFMHVWDDGHRFVYLLVHLILVGFAIVVVGILIGYLQAQTIRRRLYDIEEAAVLMANGRLQHRIARYGERDEIDSLAAQFNRMGERIEQQVALLQKLAAENLELAQSAERAATIEERQRVSRELHDSVSQQLFSLTLLAAAAGSQYRQGSAKLMETIQHIEELSNQAQREMRALLLHLRPVELDGRTLTDAAPSFLQSVEERHGLAWSFHAEGVKQLPAAVEEQLFRILQEAISNVLKHAQASRVVVELAEHLSLYQLTVSDDGRGFAQDVGSSGDTYGLKAMRERAAYLGGRLEILHRDKGMTVQVIIPKTSAPVGEE